MKRNCSFRVLKCLLNLKFYDSDETVTLPENKIRTGSGASSPWRQPPAAQEGKTPPDRALARPAQDSPRACSPDKGGDMQKVCPECMWGMCHS